MPENAQNNQRKQPHGGGFLSTGDGTGNMESPEKVQSKRSKPNPTTSPINIFKAATSSGVDSTLGSNFYSIEDKLPLWVAGASPAKFVSLDDVIRINNSLEKMAIVHEIAVDPEFRVEDLQKRNRVYDAVKTNMHKAYWDMLREDLQKDPQDFNFAFQLLKDLKEMICEHLTSNNLNNGLTLINEILDFEHLSLRFKQGALDFHHVLRLVLKVLGNLCAPVRDELVKNLSAETSLVELFKGIFELVEFMRVDMANFALVKNRGTIENYSAQIEREEFMKALELDPCGAQYTELWLRNILANDFPMKSPSLPLSAAFSSKSISLEKSFNEESGAENSITAASESQDPTKNLTKSTGEFSHENPRKRLTETQLRDLIISFYLCLLDMDPTGDSPSRPADLRTHFPETLLLDRDRFLALGEKFLQLELTTAAIFIASNLAGKRACETRSEFKVTLKNELIIILNDVSYGNYVEKLDNVFLQCEKDLAELDPQLNGAWTPERSALLKKQIHGLSRADDSIRSIARSRIRAFLELVLRRDGERIQLPAGLGSIQSELAAFTSKVFAIIVHNWNAFGAFYAQILQRAYHEKRESENECRR